MNIATAGNFSGTHQIEPEFAREHLLTRYARGRVKRFGERQFLTFFGVLLLWTGYGAWAGLSAGALALFGEALDCAFLRTVDDRLKRGEPVARLSRIATVTGAVQGATVSACVVLAWILMREHGSLFPAAFLVGAALNAGLVLPYARWPAAARLTIYGLTALGLMAFEGVVAADPGIGLYLDLAGMLLLTFVVYAFFDFVSKGAARHRANVTELGHRQREIEIARQRLKRREREAQRLSLVARNANDSIFLCDSDGLIVWVNAAFTRLTGYSPSEAVGRRAGDLLDGPHKNSETTRAMAQALKNGEPYRGELRNVSKDGREIWIETNQVPIFDSERRVETVIAIERDVTEARNHAREVAKARDRAEMGARAKAEFLANMSHEIRTPMNGIIGMADLLNETELAPAQRTYAETIKNSADGLLTIINDVLDLSKLDAGKLILHPVDFELKACFSDVMMLFGPQAQTKDIQLHLELADNLPTHVHADEARLRQLLMNLVGNAVKFTESGRVTLAVTCREDTRGSVLEIVVADTGIGISQKELDGIFARFNQAQSSTTRRYGGTGLGLTISKMLTGLMGGTIDVSSEPGKGSRFALTLPVCAPQRPARPVGRNMPDLDKIEDLRGKRLLVAEDNRVNRLLVEKYLADIPVELSFAHNGAEAVDMARRDRPDIILMDMSMPEKSGIEAARDIRDIKTMAQPVIVALTANAFASDRAACLEAGMDGFLTKPIRRSELLSELLRFSVKQPESL